LTAAGRAGGRDLEEPARLDNLPLPSAVVARDGDGPLAGSRPLALVAKLLPIDVDWLGRAPRGLEQLDLELEEQVLPRPRPAPALAEQVAEEAASEDVSEGRHDVLGAPEVVDAGPFHARVTVAVVALALRLVGEDLVRLGGLLESLL